MTLDVFFSYDSDDRLIVSRIKNGIEDRAGGEIDIYRYEDDLQPGGDISEKAEDRIRESDLFLVLITPNSQDSAWVQQEVGFANGVGCEVVPILLEAPERPELKGLLKGRESLLFDQDSPNDFFEDFMDYAKENPLEEDQSEINWPFTVIFGMLFGAIFGAMIGGIVAPFSGGPAVGGLAGSVVFLVLGLAYVLRKRSNDTVPSDGDVVERGNACPSPEDDY